MLNTVYIIDDHEVFLNGLRYTLQEYRITKNIRLFLETKYILQKLNEELPDMIIADQVLKNENGLELLHKVKFLNSNIKCVLVSSYKSSKLKKICMENNIEGYIFKDENQNTIANALKLIAEGGKFYSEIKRTKKKYVSRFSINPFDKFTARELDIVRSLAVGMTHKEIADKFQIAKKTIDIHRVNIASKMNHIPTVKIILEAFNWGVVSDEDLED